MGYSGVWGLTTCETVRNVVELLIGCPSVWASVSPFWMRSNPVDAGAQGVCGYGELCQMVKGQRLVCASTDFFGCGDGSLGVAIDGSYVYWW